MKRILNPATNAPGLAALAAALWTIGQAVWNAAHHQQVANTADLTSAAAFVVSLLTRFVVTPTADPKNGAGIPLAPVTAAPFPATGGGAS